MAGIELTQGEGCLSELEKLKAEHGPQFKADALKRRRLNQKCLELLCPYAIGRLGIGKGGILRIKVDTCTRRRCPKDKVE